MDLSLLRSTNILGKYQLNSIPRDGEGSDSGPGDSWGGDSAGVSYADSGSYFGAFDSGNIGGAGFDSNTFDSGGWNGGWYGGSTYGGNNFDGGGWGVGGGVSYGDAGFGPGGFGTGSFGFNGGAFDYGGGNAFTGLGPGGGGWDAGPWGAGAFGYDQGFGGMYSNPAMDAWGPGSYSAWGGFGTPSAYDGYNGMFGPMSGMAFNSDYGPAFNSFGLNPGSYYNGEGQGWPFDFGNIGSQGSFGYGAGNGLLGYGEVGSWLGGPPDTSGMFGPSGNPLAAPDPGFQVPAYPNEGIQNMPLNEPAYTDIGYQLGGKDQSQFAPNNNPLGYPDSTWDAASYFGSPNVTNQAQDSRDSFASRFGEWGVPNANPYVANVATDPNNFEGRFGGPYPAATQWTSDTYLGDAFGRGGNVAEWGRAAPSNVAALDYPTDTFDSRFGGPYPEAAAPDYGPNTATIHGPAQDYSAPLSELAGTQNQGYPVGQVTNSPLENMTPTPGDIQVAYDFLGGGPNAGPQLGLGGPLSGLVSTYDNPFAPAVNQEFAYPTAQQELGDLANFGPGYVNNFNQAENYALTAPDLMTYSPGLIGGGLGYDLGANFGVGGANTGKADALNNYAQNINQNYPNQYEALQQAIEGRGGLMPTLDETGRSINDVMDAARAAQMNNQNIGREQNYPTLQEFLGPPGLTTRGDESRSYEAPSRGGEVTTRGGRTDLSPDNSREAAQTARSVTQAISRGDPNSMAYLNSLLNEARTAPTLAGRVAALDALNGIISAMKGAGHPNPFGRDPDPFIASQLRQGR